MKTEEENLRITIYELSKRIREMENSRVDMK
jgi:hypothetical protein